MPPWTDEHSRLVAEAAPRVHEPDSDVLDQAWAQIQTDLHVPAVPRGRRRLRAAAGGAVVAAILGASGYAAAEMWTAHTGEYNTDPESVSLGGPGEFIDPGAPDFPQVLAEITADIPFATVAERLIAGRLLLPVDLRVALID